MTAGLDSRPTFSCSRPSKTSEQYYGPLPVSRVRRFWIPSYLLQLLPVVRRVPPDRDRDTASKQNVPSSGSRLTDPYGRLTLEVHQREPATQKYNSPKAAARRFAAAAATR